MFIKYKFLLLLAVLIIGSTSTLACISLPVVEMKKTGSQHDDICSRITIPIYSFSYTNESCTGMSCPSAFNESAFYNSFKQTKLMCNITDEDISIILKLIKGKYSSFNVNEQTDSDYKKFLRSVAWRNIWRSKNNKIEVVREGRWTGHNKITSSSLKNKGNVQLCE